MKFLQTLILMIILESFLSSPSPCAHGVCMFSPCAHGVCVFSPCAHGVCMSPLCVHGVCVFFPIFTWSLRVIPMCAWSLHVLLMCTWSKQVGRLTHLLSGAAETGAAHCAVTFSRTPALSQQHRGCWGDYWPSSNRRQRRRGGAERLDLCWSGL